MANIITELHLEMSANWYVTKKLNSIGRVGENTVTKLIIEPTEILDNVTYEIEIMSADGSKNVAELTVDGAELYLILTANMLTTSGIMKMQVRGLFTDGSIKKSNIFELKVNRSISATEHYEEYAVTIFDQLVQDCRDIIEGAESYAVRAETAAVNAEAYEQSASTSAEAASASANTASTSATTATTAAETATAASTSAHTSAETATTAASSASASASTAVGASESAQTAASNANTSATNAANSASSAATSATNAHTSEVNASTSETNASTSATEAAASAESIAASVAQINENTYRINDLEAIIGGYQLADLPTSAIATVTDGTALLMPSLKVGIEPVQEGSGDPSPTNIRPISGWTAANVTRTGKNISPDTYNIGMYDVNGTYINSNNYRSTDKFAVIPNTQYTSSLFNSANTRINNLVAVEFDKNKSPLKIQNVTSSFTTSPNTYYISLRNFDVNISDVQSENFHYQLELGSTATTYEPYNCTTYTVQFTDGDNPLTVYGGTLDVTSGELVVDRYKGILAPATSSIVVSSAKQCIFPTPSVANGYTLVDTKLMCDKLAPSNYSTTEDNHIMFSNANLFSIVLSNEAGTTKEAWAQWLTDMQISVCYKLATPTTYHLTPTQIRTLVGNNNIWADTGDIIEGKYYKSLT